MGQNFCGFIKNHINYLIFMYKLEAKHKIHENFPLYGIKLVLYYMHMDSFQDSTVTPVCHFY